MSADTLRAAAAASASSPVWVDGDFYLVPLPTIRQFCEIGTLLQGAVGGDDDDLAALQEELWAWLPARVAAALAELEPAAFVGRVSAFLNAGVQPTAPRRALDSELDTGAPDLWILLGDYVRTFGGEIWTIYNTTPWPFFVAALDRIRAASARELLHLAEVEILPHTGKASKKLLGDLLSRSKYRPKAERDEPAYAPPEVIQRDRANLRALLGAPAAPETET